MLEHKNFDEIGDRGEVWFGEAAMNRMIRWLEKNVPQSSKIIDLGCGNGVMSIELYEVGFKNVLGVDYSSHAIELAQKIALENDIPDLKFEVSFSYFFHFFIYLHKLCISGIAYFHI